MATLIFAGKSAYSHFRLDRLRDRLNSADAPGPRVGRLQAEWLYLLSTRAPLAGDEPGRLRMLLDLHPEERESLAPESGTGIFVTPRLGTVSPWSSKATEILQHAGIRSVRRVERGLRLQLWDSSGRPLSPQTLSPARRALLHDRMTQGMYTDLSAFFEEKKPAPLQVLPVLDQGLPALAAWNKRLGLALHPVEIQYLFEAYRQLGRDPTDVELVMFAQVNSEHCRHKIFNAAWRVKGQEETLSLFQMIQNTHQKSPGGTRLAYSDNAAVIDGFHDGIFEPHPDHFGYTFVPGWMDIVIKVETHNHPTAIAPHPGAATGVGGEIRDEGATGRGGRPKAGLSGFMVSHLNIPDFVMPWEYRERDFPQRLASPLAIMLEGPIGGAAFGNEFGRPQLAGFFRTMEITHESGMRGYHKPVMVAGGMGTIKRDHTLKQAIGARAAVVQIGGPALRIGIGGGAASSMATGSNLSELDFASVQRDNPEMQRRCQEVINTCIALGDDNPILSIHDIGAGGLSNACPELMAETGALFNLRRVPNEEISMSPMEIWCCEAQERYVLAVDPGQLDRFLEIAARERCPAAIIGEATGDRRLVIEDAHFQNRPVDLHMDMLLGRPPRMTLEALPFARQLTPLVLDAVRLEEAMVRVLRFPAVADKSFLITIADRSVSGLVARDQMVGPYQVPIADCAVTATSFLSHTGEVMAMGERSPLALIDAPASGRMAVAEAITNLAGQKIGELGQVKLSANWMCACGDPAEDTALYETVKAIAMEFCPRLGISIPVGKDSLSMRTVWQSETGCERTVTAPLTLVISAFAPVQDLRSGVTPELKPLPSRLLLVDLGRGACRMGGSVLAQVYRQIGDRCPDLDVPEELHAFFKATQNLLGEGLLLAYHDRSDGGLITTVVEMAIGGRLGVTLRLPAVEAGLLPALFNEEAGAVFQVRLGDEERVEAILAAAGLSNLTQWIGETQDDPAIRIEYGGAVVYEEPLVTLRRAWSELSFHMQSLRDNPECAREAFDRILDPQDPGLKFQSRWQGGKAARVAGKKPVVAILREQGINGQVEMAAAFDQAGFLSRDVHMTDLLQGLVDLESFAGLVACGGFSYGDVLGAGAGWAKTILFHPQLREMFRRFFERDDTFSLGVCNGCQMLSQLKELIPGAAHWPHFSRNRSEQFEARYARVKILPSPSIFFKGMEDSLLGIPVAHGEGRADFQRSGSLEQSRATGSIAMCYVDPAGNFAARYPDNPNGSPDGITALTTIDGRVTILMPHPERAFRNIQLSYRPPDWKGEFSPWFEMFLNARRFAK